MRCGTVIRRLFLVLLVAAKIAIGTATFIGEPNAYTEWLESRGKRFTHARFLSIENGALVLRDPVSNEASVAFHWIIENGKISIAVGAEAVGWLAFGFTEMGGMSGADIVTFEASSGNLQDMYSVAYEHPKADSQQDWTLVHSATDDGLIIFEAERKLVTGDPMDWVLEDDTSLLLVGTRIVAAWGDSTEMQYHGPQNRLQATLRLFAESNHQTDKIQFDRAMADAAEGTVSMYMRNSTISAEHTTSYKSTCISVKELGERQGLPMDKPVHLLGFEFDLDPGTMIHHVVFYSSTRATRKGNCRPRTGPTTAMHVWNKGQSRAFYFPDEVAMLLADESERAGEGLGVPPKSFRLEIHFENTDKVEGTTDSSGVRLYYTTELRKYTGETMELADPQVMLLNYPVGDGIRRHSYSCPSSCTQRYLPHDGVKVLYQLLHMHAAGLTMELVHKQSGQSEHSSAVQYFDAASGGQIVTNSFTVMPGDSFQTICTYQGNPNLRFGPGTTQEMCLASLFYYPAATSAHLMCTAKSSLRECRSTHANETLKDESSLARTFGVPGQTPDREQVPTPSQKLNEKLKTTALGLQPGLIAIFIVFFWSVSVFALRLYYRRPELDYKQVASSSGEADGGDRRVLELTQRMTYRSR